MSKVKFTDKRNREWEVFEDYAYYECICVRLVGDRSFNSNTTFHFATQAQADKFIESIKESF